MLSFQWDALKVGDRVLVHEDLDDRFELHEGTVSIVDTQASGHDVGIGVSAGGGWHVVRPRRLAVHLVPLDPRGCWRCDAIAHPAQRMHHLDPRSTTQGSI